VAKSLNLLFYAFIILRLSINFLLALPVRDITSHARSRLVFLLQSWSRTRWDTSQEREREREREREKGERERKRDFFPKRQFTVKLLGEAWRILRGVQQVVGCNKLLPATSGSFQASSYLHSLFVRLSPCFYTRRSIRDACILGFSTFHIVSRQSHQNPMRTH